MNAGSDSKALHAYLELQRYAETVLGSRAWTLLRSYGKLMSGPFAGVYVSGLPTDLAFEIVDALAQGQTIHVHLMHRHKSGKSEISSLRLLDGKLVMQFLAREELA